jgi:hypothetical protein
MLANRWYIFRSSVLWHINYKYREIKHQVIRQYRTVDASKTVELFDGLFECLFSKLDSQKECLVIFTTNYDPAIEVFCKTRYSDYHLCDGFEYHPANRDSYWDRSVFDQFTIQPNKRNIVLFKMHGSVDWLKEMSSGHIHRGQAMFDSLDSDAYSNVLIYPATRKIATSEPYYSGYSAAFSSIPAAASFLQHSSYCSCGVGSGGAVSTVSVFANHMLNASVSRRIITVNYFPRLFFGHPARRCQGRLVG